MNFHSITLFPDIVDSYTSESILGRAKENKHINVNSYQLRDFTRDKHRRTDGIAYGGGPGMILWVDPVVNAFEKILKDIISKNKSSKNKKDKSILVINFVPAALKFTNTLAKEYVKKYTDIIFICGRYEGVDARVNEVIEDILKSKKSEIGNQNKLLKAEHKSSENKDILKKKLLAKLNYEIENISIGDYVLTGGEVAACVMIDAISRQVEGVLNKNESLEENRVSSHTVYARPEIYERKIGDIKKIKKYTVPKVLLSGNHKEIENWKLSQNLL